jgi:hypothetical protein
MSFKINPPYALDNTPVYNSDMEGGVLGRTNKNGTILVNNDLSGKDIDRVIKHEKVHVEQFKNGDLDYDDENFYWKGKKYNRSEMDEGNKKLPWERPAYKKSS